VKHSRHRRSSLGFRPHSAGDGRRRYSDFPFTKSRSLFGWRKGPFGATPFYVEWCWYNQKPYGGHQPMIRSSRLGFTCALIVAMVVPGTASVGRSVQGRTVAAGAIIDRFLAP